MKSNAVGLAIASIIVIALGAYSLGYVAGLHESIAGSVTGAVSGSVVEASSVLPWLGLIALLISGTVLAMSVIRQYQDSQALQVPVEPTSYYAEQVAAAPPSSVIQAAPPVQKQRPSAFSRRISSARSNIDKAFAATGARQGTSQPAEQPVQPSQPSSYNKDVVERLKKIHSVPQPKRPF